MAVGLKDGANDVDGEVDDDGATDVDDSATVELVRITTGTLSLSMICTFSSWTAAPERMALMVAHEVHKSRRPIIVPTMCECRC